jgi:hypothetical protein
MHTAVQQANSSLDAAEGLARSGLRIQHSRSYRDAWDEAAALALVSIARSLESIAATIDETRADAPVSRNGRAAL